MREGDVHGRHLFEDLPEALIVHDGEVVLDANRAAALLLGTPGAPNVTGRRLDELVAPRYRETVRSHGQVLLAGRRDAPLGEIRLLTVQGGAVDVEATGLSWSFGGKPAVLLYCRDLTARKRIERALNRYAERLVLLHKLDQEILESHGSATVAEATLAHLQRLIPFDFSSVLLFDFESADVHVIATDWDGDETGAGTRMPMETYGMVAQLTSGSVLTIDDLARQPQPSPFEKTLVGRGVRSILAVPLVANDHVIGALHLGARPGAAFDVEHVDIAREVATVLSLAIHSARLFEEIAHARRQLEHLSHHLVQVQEQERRHLALELHDEIGQSLTALRLTVDIDDPTVPEDVRRKLARATELVHTLTSRVRDLSLDLRPTHLDDLGLLPALLWYVPRFERHAGMKVAFEHSGIADRRFRPDVETGGYRIVQEALTNVARHAGVSEAAVRVWVEKDAMHVLVSDEGCGFDPALVLASGTSNGISGMRERARLAGGDCHVAAARGEGVRIRAVLPLRLPEAPGAPAP